MIVNPKKFQLLISAKSNTKRFIGTPIIKEGKTIYFTDSIKFLGINIDNELKYNEHTGSLCKKSRPTIEFSIQTKQVLNF